jgi:hypothetical protein
MKPGCVVEQSRPNPVLYLGDCIPELFRDRLTLESLNGIRMGCGRHDDKGYNRGSRTSLLKSVIEA